MSLSAQHRSYRGAVIDAADEMSPVAALTREHEDRPSARSRARSGARPRSRLLLRVRYRLGRIRGRAASKCSSGLTTSCSGRRCAPPLSRSVRPRAMSY